MKKMPFLILVCFLSLGCAILPVQRESFRREEVFDIPYDTIWDSLMAIAETGGNTLDLSDKHSGIVNACSPDDTDVSFHGLKINS